MAETETQTQTPQTPETPVQAPARRLFTATLILGVPGSGKTSLLKTYADYLWETYKKVLLLYSWDGGAIPTDVQRGMKQGIIRFWRARTRSAEGLGLETLYLASRGYWPRLINAETGETSPAVRLVAPVTVKYHVSCPHGHALQTVPALSLVSPMFCAGCNTFIAQHELRIREEMGRTKGFEAVGGVAFDGLTSMTDVVMDHMDDQRGAGNIGGEKAAFGGVVVSGDLKWGGNNRADVGFGQSRARRFVHNSLSIPYLVEGPVFTALAMEATDEGGLPIVGPKLPGRAATDEASAWFGNVMECGKITDDKSLQHFCLYLRPFTDAQGRRHLLKTSSSPVGLPDKLVDPPEEVKQPFVQVNLGLVFRELDNDLRRSLLQELPGAPGIPTEMMEYGEATTIETASAGQIPMIAPIGGQPAMPRPQMMVAGRGAIVTLAAPAPAPTAPAVVAPAPQGTAPAPAAPAAPPVSPAPAPPASVGPVLVSAPGKKRARGKTNGGDGSTVPIAPAAPAAPTVPQTPQAPLGATAPTPLPLQPAAPPPVPSAPVQAMAPPPKAPPSLLTPTGTTPPPPPGMRPPMKAPGA